MINLKSLIIKFEGRMYGPNAAGATRLSLAIDEDWYLYSERKHTTELRASVLYGIQGI